MRNLLKELDVLLDEMSDAELIAQFGEMGYEFNDFRTCDEERAGISAAKDQQDFPCQGCSLSAARNPETAPE